VFVGEEKKGKIIGLHNWVQFYFEEKKGNIDYLGEYSVVLLCCLPFTWLWNFLHYSCIALPLIFLIHAMSVLIL
jgi:hypothetical protein